MIFLFSHVLVLLAGVFFKWRSASVTVRLMVLALVLAGIRQLQLMLLKIALLLGVEFHVNVEFVKLAEPPEDQENEGETD